MVVVAQVKVTKSRGRMAAKVEGILCSTVAEVILRSTVAEVKVVGLPRSRAFSVVLLQRSRSCGLPGSRAFFVALLQRSRAFSVAPLQRSRSFVC